MNLDAASEKPIPVLVPAMTLVCLLIVFAGLTLLALRMHRASVEDNVGEYLVDASSAYDKGAIEETTNAYCRYINYLGDHRRDLAGRLKVDLMLYVAHSRLSYFFLAHEDLSNAQLHLRHAYLYYQATGAAHKGTNEFLDYVIEGNEAMALKANLSWKPHGTHWTNIVSEVRNIGF
jgi:hypothetical protein